MRRARGLSLLEILITGVLFGVVLAAVAGLLGQFNRALNHSSKRSQATEGALALREVAAEVEESIALISPAGGPSSLLELTRINPAYPGRLPATMPSPAPGAWEPADPAYLMTVRFQVNGQRQLEREVIVGGASTRQVIALEVNSFTVSRTQNRVDLQAFFQEEQQVRPILVHANLKVAPWP